MRILRVGLSACGVFFMFFWLKLWELAYPGIYTITSKYQITNPLFVCFLKYLVMTHSVIPHRSKNERYEYHFSSFCPNKAWVLNLTLQTFVTLLKTLGFCVSENHSLVQGLKGYVGSREMQLQVHSWSWKLSGWLWSVLSQLPPKVVVWKNWSRQCCLFHLIKWDKNLTFFKKEIITDYCTPRRMELADILDLLSFQFIKLWCDHINWGPPPEFLSAAII